MNDFKFIMVITWCLITVISAILLFIGVFNGYNSKIELHHDLYTQASLITFIIGVLTLISYKDDFD